MTYLAELTAEVEKTNREKGWYDEPGQAVESLGYLFFLTAQVEQSDRDSAQDAMTCRVEGCDRARRPGRTVCHMHAHRLARYGDVGRPGPKIIPGDDEGRFWAKVDRTEECWWWRAALDASGYGAFAIKGQVRRAHRVAYELIVGPIPDGLQLDHLCRNRSCVNPSHLEPVTNAENQRRALRKTCGRGHPLDEESPDRYCKTCKSDWRRRRAELRRERP